MANVNWLVMFTHTKNTCQLEQSSQMISRKRKYNYYCISYVNKTATNYRSCVWLKLLASNCHANSCECDFQCQKKQWNVHLFNLLCVYMAHLRYPANIFAFSWLVIYIYIYICSSIYIIPIHQFRQKTTSTNLRIPTVHDLNQGLHSSMQARSRGPAFVLLEGHLHAGPCVLVQCRSEHPKMKGTNRCDPF